MTIDTSFKGAAAPLGNNDAEADAQAAGIPPVNLLAVINTETSGAGFDSEGRPKMLFEPHIFWNHLPPNLQTVAQDAGLAYPRWGMAPYPADSYPRLVQAIAIDETAALLSASWGLGQIMGGNYQEMGYACVQDMVTDAMSSEDAQLQQMIKFIGANPAMLSALANGDWAAFARAYNGPGYAQNHYDTKLASYAAAHQEILSAPDTGSNAPEPEPAPQDPASQDQAGASLDAAGGAGATTADQLNALEERIDSGPPAGAAS